MINALSGHRGSIPIQFTHGRCPEHADKKVFLTRVLPLTFPRQTVASSDRPYLPRKDYCTAAKSLPSLRHPDEPHQSSLRDESPSATGLAFRPKTRAPNNASKRMPPRQPPGSPDAVRKTPRRQSSGQGNSYVLINQKFSHTNTAYLLRQSSTLHFMLKKGNKAKQIILCRNFLSISNIHSNNYLGTNFKISYDYPYILFKILQSQ